MSPFSFNRLLRMAPFARGASADTAAKRPSTFHATRDDTDELRGRIGGRGSSATGSGGSLSGGLSRAMDRRVTLQRRFGLQTDEPSAAGGTAFDTRQRVVVKAHYFPHANGGGAALKAHTAYVARDGAQRRSADAHEDSQPAGREAEHDRDGAADAHARYLGRSGSQHLPVFYDATSEGITGAAQAEQWSRSDRRHFRLILAPENGAAIRDLPAYTREVMARAEAALGAKLQWIAVDHHDTDNPHVHLILRGRKGNGQDLILPREFVKHGLRNIARDVATEWLGSRSAADERLALEREVRRHAPTRLDRMIAAQLPKEGAVRIAGLTAPNGDPAMTQALKARARELQRLGLAKEMKRNVLAFEPDWRGRLNAMELHLNIRKRIVQERTLGASQDVSNRFRARLSGLERP